MRHTPAIIPCLLAVVVFLSLAGAPGFCGEEDEWPHAKEMKKCPKCPAMFDAAPHPYDFKQCPKCQAALNKSLAYVKKHFKPTMFGLLLDSFYGGFVFLMDSSENHNKELAVCTKNCREMLKGEPDGNFASPTQIGGDWFSWKKSMAMYFLAEYSLRYGLTTENKAALLEGLKAAADGEQKGGGWFHGRPKEKQYAPDIAIIGCIFYAAFLEMKALGLSPGPLLEETRTYLEGVSDGKTIGYGKGWHGGMGGGGADGFITLGLLGSGNSDDKWDLGLAAWMKANYMDAGHGHANGELHYFGMGAALHRLGPEHYARFATCHIHRLIEIQRADGSLPGMSHDDPNETEYYQKLKSDLAAPGDFPATAVLACLILMERPGAFSPLPSKAPGSMSNKDAFNTATEALAKEDYAKALKAFALVLPRGDNGELVPQAREQMQKIEAIAKEKLQPLQAKEAQLPKNAPDKPDSKEVLIAYADMVQQYEKFQKDFEGTAAAQEARQLCEPVRKELSAKRQRLAFGSGAAGAGSTSSSAATALKNPGAAKEWDAKLKARVAAVVATGGKPRFDFKALSMQVTIESLTGKDSFKATMARGGQMDMNWAQLQPADLRSLAVELAALKDTPGDHALAAFYLLCNKEAEKAEEHLRKADKEAAAVNAAFEGH